MIHNTLVADLAMTNIFESVFKAYKASHIGIVMSIRAAWIERHQEAKETFLWKFIEGWLWNVDA
jgi:hypothetical protein